MLKKQHKKSSADASQRQQAGRMPRQPGTERDAVGRSGARGKGDEVTRGAVQGGNQGGQPRSPRTQPRGANLDEELEEGKQRR